MANLTRERFVALARGRGGVVAIPVGIRLLSDQLTPVLAYRRLVSADDREAPSFLLESIEGGERQGRHSILGAQPIAEVVAKEHEVRVWRHAREAERVLPGVPDRGRHSDPLEVVRGLVRGIELVLPEEESARPTLPACVLGGLFGYSGYDTVRYAEAGKLPFAGAPRDDRGLPDLHFGLYDGVVVFDHVDKLVHVVQVGLVWPGDDAGAAYDAAMARVEARAEAIQRHSRPLPAGRMEREGPRAALSSNVTRAAHAEMVGRAQEYIRAGDIFQVVIGQRFERRSPADPFDVYRALRAVNPSPYMVYMQSPGCILVASSPEILCRVRKKVRRHEGTEARVVDGAALEMTNRPLAGTRRRGRTAEEDSSLERELLADPKERAEHIMLVDLGRNDVGRVCEAGTVALGRVMEVERYSHVMHISSTVTGEVRAGLDAWDALRAALPVGTISGAPKIRAMQIIDELEVVRRGPYGGGMGYVGLDGQMDIALALRTMVVPTAARQGATWTYHLQAAGGIVADSEAGAEYEETVNKAAGLARAIDLAESAFG